MIGVSGPTYLSNIPGIWWGIDNIANPTYSIRQLSLDTNRLNPTEQHITNINPFKEKVSEVVACDGLFFCIRKDLFHTIRFDEDYGGFHFYDIDISMQVHRLNYKILCVYDIFVEHISASVLNKEWINSSRFFYDKWHDFLPVKSSSFERNIVEKMEQNNMQTMFHALTGAGVSFFHYFTIKEILRMIYIRPFFILRKICKRFVMLFNKS